jgi:predicted nucleic acid-binding protein
MNMMVDTQILSYRFKGIDKDIHSKTWAISSITANEFLETQPKDSKKPDYYIIHPARYPHLFDILDAKCAKMGEHRTDQVIIDFGNQFPAYREFGNEAISEIINQKKFETYKLSISHFPKQKQKDRLKKLMYILDNDYQCYSLTKSALEEGLSLFSQFTSKHNCKANIRNTVNDILILATAIDRKKVLLTHDKLLNRFAAEYYEVPIEQDKNELLIDFSKKAVDQSKNRESKGYINSGWSYAVRNNRAAPET